MVHNNEEKSKTKSFDFQTTQNHWKALVSWPLSLALDPKSFC